MLVEFMKDSHDCMRNFKALLPVQWLSLRQYDYIFMISKTIVLVIKNYISRIYSFG